MMADGSLLVQWSRNSFGLFRKKCGTASEYIRLVSKHLTLPSIYLNIKISNAHISRNKT
jgi:hypothetical protein